MVSIYFEATDLLLYQISVIFCVDYFGYHVPHNTIESAGLYSALKKPDSVQKKFIFFYVSFVVLGQTKTSVKEKVTSSYYEKPRVRFSSVYYAMSMVTIKDVFRLKTNSLWLKKSLSWERVVAQNIISYLDL
ncbi:hypothetical protein PHYBLDRAFT_163326 [Phycomyces blakesleeanus NRRL 1555(-)]|uniref:Uncharacterized protein n=1 Tax=Phycomyces blakesleeanus (strain ATCC 8743b / DSM 1359 / FGSC 10004 / NBRC 33097 / NRRL 1555) TaxID=763407 RepID=A0A167PMB3_PHYB8|nr:hypothetical protein PHYBLDRAFT_163326 [Phycomyces blakesleeanus NRRL 1555(-)]OAD78207.1 hypothetical protein PHYBLDRAFT_163326 [Phycomyces blakesleeanus NRRL 1555(-)]|eukprot:XP_018296247.1 hypothetical protein PHYBLDRAFT_163326 [Phycomyces blakesleeanus NRRL 1555(-)]